MGEAKRKGSKAERVATAIERQQQALGTIAEMRPDLADEDRLRNRQTLKDIHNGKPVSAEDKERLHKQRLMSAMQIGLMSGALQLIQAQRRSAMPPPTRVQQQAQSNTEE